MQNIETVEIIMMWVLERSSKIDFQELLEVLINWFKHCIKESYTDCFLYQKEFFKFQCSGQPITIFKIRLDSSLCFFIRSYLKLLTKLDLYLSKFDIKHFKIGQCSTNITLLWINKWKKWFARSKVNILQHSKQFSL